MWILLIIVVVLLVIYFIRKSISGSNLTVVEPVRQQISFDNLSEEDQNVRNEIFDNIMQGSHSKELTNCYDKIKSIFIPKKNGEFSGSMSGLLSEKSRAKTLAATDETVARILGNDTREYAVWYGVLFDNLLNEIYFSGNGKLAQLTKIVINDVQQGDDLLKSVGAIDKIFDPDNSNASMKIRTENTTIKIETKSKEGRLHYEIKGVYAAFKEGLCLDDELVRKAEILMAICAKYEYGPKYEFRKSEVEKYALPNLRNHHSIN